MTLLVNHNKTDPLEKGIKNTGNTFIKSHAKHQAIHDLLKPLLVKIQSGFHQPLNKKLMVLFTNAGRGNRFDRSRPAQAGDL